MASADGMKVIRVVLEIDKCSMTVLCEKNGFRKNIRLSWKQRGITNIPPADWRKQALFELEHERSTQGRKMPF